MVVWHIWKARNKLVFDGVSSDPMDTWQKASRDFYTMSATLHASTNTRLESTRIDQQSSCLGMGK